MKNKILIITILMSIFSFAQLNTFGKNPIIHLENFDKPRTHGGFFLGFNSYDYKIDYKNIGQEINVNSSIGFNVGLIGNLRINEYLDLRFEPGLHYNTKTLQFSNFTNPLDATREVNSTYINFPLLLKFSSKRTGNIKPYLIGGVSRTLNLSSNEQAIDDNSNNRFRSITWSNNYEIGFGIDIYLQYFKFSPSIRGVFGLNNEILPDRDPNSPWTSNVSNFTTRGFFVNFAFH
ncbi:MAG: porin family protein [Flavobacterium sp.]